MSHRRADTAEARPLTEGEQALLRWLLTRGAALTGTDACLAASFLPQIGAVRVVAQCGCGCPTIDLALGEAALAVPAISATLANVEGESPEGTQIGVILRATQGSLCELELYPRDGRIPFSLPGLEQLRSFS
jgi:hypothetical protein